MISKSCLSDEIENNISEKNFKEINVNSNLNSNSNTNSIFLSITHKTQIINNTNTNNININSEDSFLNLLDSIKKPKKLDYKQFYDEVKKLVIEESSSENENEIFFVLNKVKEMAKTIKQIKKKETKNIEKKLGENMEQQSDIKTKTTKIAQIDDIINKDKKLSINNYSYNCAVNDYLPELLSPENNYKLFINSLKQFEYEEKIYDKYLTHDDLQIMKSFPEKLYKYFGHLYAFKMKKKLNI